jgi:PAS domain S-box-containing protein
VRYVNAAAGRQIRCAPKDLLQHTIFELDPHWTPERWRNYWQELCKRGSITHEGELLRMDGTLLPAEINANSFEFDGKTYDLGFIRDITERKRLQAREAMRTTILEQLTKGDALPDVLSAIVHAVEAEQPQALASILLLDKNRERLLIGACPSFPQSFRNVVDGMRVGPTAGCCGTAAWSGKRVITADIQADPNPTAFRNIAADVGLVSCWAQPIADRLGQVLGTFSLYGREASQPSAEDLELLQAVANLAGVAIEHRQAEEEIRQLNVDLERRVRERTRELAASEERMRLFFNHKLVGAAITAPEKHAIHTNDKLCQIFGYSHEELSRLQWPEVTYPEDLPAELEQHERMLRGESDGYTIEKRLIRKDGSIVYANFAVSCVRKADGSIDYLVSMVEDISERKKAEQSVRRLHQDLQQRAEQLEAANKELESFSYSVSHDLRAPLRSIDGFSKALEEDFSAVLGAEGQSYIDTIRAAARRMSNLIDDMLMLARVSRSELVRKPMDLAVLAATVVCELRQADPERQLEFINAAPLLVNGDARLLRIVLDNLLGNAWKFTSRQSLSTIEFGRTTRDGVAVYFIRDNGVGFDMAHAKKLFGAFERLHAATEFPGSGIGLATVQRVIQRHGGRVWAESEPGKGATFFFTLEPDPKPSIEQG